MIKDVVTLAEKLIRLKTVSRYYHEIRECAKFLDTYA